MLLTEDDNGKTLEISAGEEVRVRLAENASSGYRWAIERLERELVEALADKSDYAANAIGSGGMVEFVFRARAAGTGEIVLKNWRHWEGDSSIISRFGIKLNVRA